MSPHFPDVSVVQAYQDCEILYELLALLVFEVCGKNGGLELKV